MVTLKEYAERTYPNHELVGDVDQTLTEHTAVGHAIGPDGLEAVRRVLRESLPAAKIAGVAVLPTDPSVIPSGGEDREGVIDLPKRRVGASAIVGGFIVGVVVGVVVGFAINPVAGVILGFFGAVIAGIVSGIAGGGARFAGQRAWHQPNAPDEGIMLVTVLTTTETDANAAARAMEQHGITDVRIVDQSGAWHTPAT